MSSTAYVEKASGWAKALTKAEARFPGDYDAAMRRVGEDIGIGYSTLFGLIYKSPKRVWADIYFTLAEAHRTMCESQRLRLEQDIADTEAACGPDANSVRSARALVREMEG